MKSRTLTLVSALLFTFLALLIFLIISIPKVRWDKVPLAGGWILGIELWSSSFDASYINEPITWEQLDVEPIDWDEKGIGSWFSVNTYTRNLLKDYMKQNNLGIVPNNWPDFKFRANLEECLETFDFVELGEPLKVDRTIEYIGYILFVMFGFFAVVCWILFLQDNGAVLLPPNTN